MHITTPSFARWAATVVVSIRDFPVLFTDDPNLDRGTPMPGGSSASNAKSSRTFVPGERNEAVVSRRPTMTRTRAEVHRIELRLNELSQLFNSMDPTPFHHKDLDRDAEEFIESWALEFPQASHFHITVHLAQMPPEDPTALVTEAIRNYFTYKAGLSRRMVTVLLREGRMSLLIGVAFLSACLLVADLLAPLEGRPLVKVVRESLTIGGWVAMWRPMQIFLYEWWPLMRRHRIYHNLGLAQVRVLPGETRSGGPTG